MELIDIGGRQVNKRNLRERRDYIYYRVGLIVTPPAGLIQTG